MNTATVEQRETHATCAWCKQDFARLMDLLDHVDYGHVDAPATAAA